MIGSSNRKAIALTLTVIMVILVIWTRFGFSQPPGDEMDIVRTGSKLAIDAITSGKGDVTVHMTRLRAQDGRSATYESETKYRVVFRSDKWRLSVVRTVLRNDLGEGVDPKLTAQIGQQSKLEILADGKEITSLQLSAPEVSAIKGSAGVINSDSFRAYEGFVNVLKPGSPGWGHKGMLDFVALDARPVPQQLFSNRTMSVAGKEFVNGNECILVKEELTAASDDKSNEINLYWFDPQRGFTVPKRQTFLEGGKYPNRVLIEEETAHMKEYQPGIWFPLKVTFFHFDRHSDGSVRRSSSWTVTYGPEFQVNVPVTDGELALELPSGTRVYEESLKASYKIP